MLLYCNAFRMHLRVNSSSFSEIKFHFPAVVLTFPFLSLIVKIASAYKVLSSKAANVESSNGKLALSISIYFIFVYLSVCAMRSKGFRRLSSSFVPTIIHSRVRLKFKTAIFDYVFPPKSTLDIASTKSGRNSAP